ncbi:MAG: 4Fe-4S binding protein [Candidatus Bathyarchaeia archaeon]
MPVIVDREKCVGCGWCITVCPNEAIEWAEKEPYDCIAEVIPEFCNDCGKCIEWCRYFAIKKLT